MVKLNEFGNCAMGFTLGSPKPKTKKNH